MSEVMLQQTQASRVVPAYRSFLRRFPDVRALARAPRSEIVRAWAGLGYNRRAVALSESARLIVLEHGGAVPVDPPTIRSLPGVGPYTAAAVASIAHGVPVAAVDTNVRRIVSRVFEGVDDAGVARVRDLATGWLDRDDAGAWNQALMDLGRDVCRPSPRCAVCPIRTWCRSADLGTPGSSGGRRHEPFEGSMRQVRGAVVRALRGRRSATLAQLSALTGHEADRVREAVRAMIREGLLEDHVGRVELSR